MAKRFDPLEFIATSPVGKAFGSSAVGKQIAVAGWRQVLAAPEPEDGDGEDTQRGQVLHLVLA